MAERRGRRKSWQIAALAAAVALCATPAAAAQLLPRVGGAVPSLPGPPVLQNLPSTVDRTTGTLGNTVNGTLDNTLDTVNGIVRDTVGRPRSDAALVARDPNGARIIRGEVLAIAPSPAALAAARTMGFTVVRQDRLAPFGFSATVLRAPDGMDTIAALTALRKADPKGRYDYNHLYDPSGATAVGDEGRAIAAPAAGALSIGMIDSGIGRDHPVFEHATLETKTFAGDKSGPATAHGTAVASLLVGDDGDFHGALSGAKLYAADVYGGKADGGSAEDIARALAWLARQHVAVVNVSLSGPPNVLLGAAVAAFVRRGHVLVAAVGNNGPAAPARYPAAYPGVAGVTSVNSQMQIQLDANQGEDVAFAARGVDVRAAALGERYNNVTGTSFAAPIVAARFAVLMKAAGPASAEKAWHKLEDAAVDLGAPGRDPVFGYGYLGRPGETAVANRSRR